MNFDKNAWVAMQLAILRKKTSLYSAKEADQIGLKFLLKAIESLPDHADEEQFEVFRLKTEALISLLPSRNEQGKLVLPVYQKTLTGYKEYVRKTFNRASAGYYTNLWIILGILLGLSFGLLIRNIASGISIGICLGIGYGAYLDKRAASEGKTL